MHHKIFLDYDYIKDHYKLIAIDLIRQKWLDADSQGIQQIEFVGQLKDGDGRNAAVAELMCVLTILGKIK